MADPAPSAALAGIRERSRLASGVWDAESVRVSPVASVVADSAMDVPLLVAALEAVLALAVEWKQIPFAVRASDECADELREAITSALTGTPQPSEDENHA